ncbi:MAG TPA: ion transporter [Anditalea sp.]|nr:ion transporter [Anditalea sp.]
METLRKKIFQLLVSPDKNYTASWFVNLFLIVLIFLNVLSIILRSVQSIYEANPHFFEWFEIFSVVVFTIEYMLRIWTADLHENYGHPPKANIKFAFTPMMIIDLLAILPFYLPFLGVDLRFMRILRLFRIFRLVRLIRFTQALHLIYRVYAKRIELLIIFTLAAVFALVMGSVMLYYIENPLQPEAFQDIPKTMWWVMGVLTTVGFGEISPISPWGRFIVMILAFSGVLLFAFAAAVISSGFTEVMDEVRENKDEVI